MKQFRLLEADEIECRVSQIAKDGSYLTILLYKTARTDADLLDETVGCDNWENDFKLVDGVLYGGIGINYNKTGKSEDMVWKWDAGTESNTEAEKGRASDAFKRAGFKHGIGRELYSAPYIRINAGDCNIKEVKQGVYKCYDHFKVGAIGYDNRERIDKLSITLKGREVYRLGGRRASQSPKPDEPHNPGPEPMFCEECMEEIRDYTSPSGVFTKAYDVAHGAYRKYGKMLCAGCAQKEARSRQAAKAYAEREDGDA